jgi:hypothetical protein
MSYLDIPRLHFSGSFCSNPSTQNNNKASFAPGASGVPAWNPMGMHWFYLQDCTVKTAIGPDGNPAPADAVVGGVVETTNDPAYGRMVDIDPDYQQASQIWGAQFKVSLKGGGGSSKASCRLQRCATSGLAALQVDFHRDFRVYINPHLKSRHSNRSPVHRSSPHSVRPRLSPLNLLSTHTIRPKADQNSPLAELSARSAHLDRLTGMRLPVWI